MKNKNVFLKLFPFLCVLMLAISAHAVFPQECTKNPPDSNGLIKYTCNFDNPVDTKGKDLGGLIDFVAKQLMPLAMMIAAIVILIAGFRYVVAVSGGKADLAAEAKRLFVPALIGAAIIVGGSEILKAVIKFAGDLGKTP